MAEYIVNPGDSLPGAVEMAGAGDIVRLMEGVHQAPVVVSGRNYTNDFPLLIVSDAGADVTLMGGVVIRESSGVQAGGFSVRGSEDDHGGVYLYRNEDCRVFNFDVQDLPASVAGAGVRLRYNTNCYVEFTDVIRCARGFAASHSVGCVWRGCRAIDNRELEDDADGFAVYCGSQYSSSGNYERSQYNALVDCESTGNHDDAFDMWDGMNVMLIRCIGIQTHPHDGNGFKLGGRDSLRPENPGGHLLIACQSLTNTEMGYTNNGGPQPSVLIGCLARGNGAHGFEEWDVASRYLNCVSEGNGGDDWHLLSGNANVEGWDVSVDDLPAWLNDAPAHIRELAIEALGREPQPGGGIVGAVERLQAAAEAARARLTVWQGSVAEAQAAADGLAVELEAIDAEIAELLAADAAADELAETL